MQVCAHDQIKIVVLIERGSNASFGLTVSSVGIKISTRLNFWRLLLAAQQMDNFLPLMIQANLVLSWASYKRSW